MEYVKDERIARQAGAAVVAAPRAAIVALGSAVVRIGKWVAQAGHTDRDCPRCGTLVRAGQRQCIACSNDFDIR